MSLSNAGRPFGMIAAGRRQMKSGWRSVAEGDVRGAGKVRAQRDGRLTRAVCVAVMFVSVLGLVSGLSGLSHPVGDVFTPLMGHFAGFSIAALAALFTGRVFGRGRLPVLSVAVLGVLVWHTALAHLRCCDGPAFGPWSRTVAPSDAAAGLRDAATTVDGEFSALSVVSLNTWHSHPDTMLLASYLALSHADVIVLTEAGPSKLAMIAKLALFYPYRASCADRWACSLVVLSRFPIVDQRIEMPAPGQPSLILARIATSKPGLAHVTIAATHLYRPSRNFVRHAAHAAALGERLARIPGPLVLAGDFNAGPYSNSYDKLLSRAALADSGRLMPTWPAAPINAPQVALDHIVVSQQLVFEAAGTGPNVGSDHLPVWALVRPRHVPVRGDDTIATTTPLAAH
jgi:endonuclease/exonuclease/phosphatase (EEP) superfamily protein YafD